MKRRFLHFLDFSAFMVALIGASAADWTPVGIVMMMIFIPCAYIGLREWAEKKPTKKAADRTGPRHEVETTQL